MMNMNEQNTSDFLIVVDCSYFRYFVGFGCVSEFQKKYPEEYDQLVKSPEETDQQNLPNLLVNEHFKSLLTKQVIKRLETVDWIAKSNFQDEIDQAEKIDIIFALDDSLKNNFRLKMFPTYKGQRKLVKRSYNVPAITDYISRVIFKELDVENRYGYHLVQVEGAEGDDVIATTMLNFRDKYADALLVASDHDFLQIDGIHQFDLYGREVKRTLGDEEVSAEDFLLGKILMGDTSDNIPQVFKKCGPKTALKLVKDKELLKQRLAESQDAVKQYQLNRKMISFKEIPKELTERIIEKVNVEVYDRRTEAQKHGVDLRDFMTW